MQTILQLLAWFIAALAASATLALIFKIAKIDLLSLGEMLIMTAGLVTFATGVVRTFTDWNFGLCLLAGVVLAFPIYWLAALPFILGLLLFQSSQRIFEKLKS